EHGRLFTKKALKNPSHTLKKLIESEKHQDDPNTSMHTYTEPDITFDAFIKLADIVKYTNVDDKKSYIELHMRRKTGFVKTEIHKQDNELLVKWKYLSQMTRAVRAFNKRHTECPGIILREKTYYTAEGMKVSSRQFKILDVLASTDHETIESSIRKLLN